MNKDIRLSVNFFDHPKTAKLERRLGLQGVKSLLTLWMWAALNRPDGNLGGINECSTTDQRPLDDEDIEIAGKWTGELGLFTKTIVDLGWIDQTSSGYSLHDWLEHNPWAAKDGIRSDKGRFSRMAKTHPELYKGLRDKGISEISAIDYERLTTSKQSFNDSLRNVKPPLTPAPAPTPAPTPAPAPSPKEEGKKIDAGVAPVVANAGSTETPIEGEIIPAVITKPLKTEAKSNQVWEAYATAYQDRYGVLPVRNAKVNSQLCQVVDRLGAEAPAVAGFYLHHNSEWYIKQAHAAQYLLNDAEKLRTEWATNRQITTKAAREADQRQTTRNSYDRLEAKYAAIDAQRPQEAAHAH